MKTLYVSDLDGTLLNSNKELTPYSADVINACIEKGAAFTVATARMAYGCDYRLAPLRLDMPGIVTNGVFLYDFARKSYLSAHTLPPRRAEQILETFAAHGLSCFVYTFEQDQLSIYYGEKSLEAQTQYFSARALEACGEVALSSDLRARVLERQVVYIAHTGADERLRPVYEEVKRIEGAASAYYLNIYNGLYCLEIFSADASKKAALLKLKEMYSFDELVVFGDNYNDLPMFEIAQRRYVPENGLPEVKARATAILPSCDEDGVARFLAEECLK